ncbi:uncharacterized protein LOC111023574 [Momordica charantia]|uniref:Uncharacterized protein LOC111023574 n=1 Tax=Momordica charantia TaxID=3673 RepID=A0A6J1DUF3_MOMCH|nr:uncharacterized protein LOC111023574 [Momordica charantia]
MTVMKGQAVADFIAGLTPYRPRADDRAQWTLYVDGSSNDKGCRAGMLLLGPGDLRFEYALQLSFKASNNEAEYEALIARLRVARGMRVNHLLILSNSQLIVNQINDGYQANDSRMERYLSKAKELLGQFRDLYCMSSVEIGELECRSASSISLGVRD